MAAFHSTRLSLPPFPVHGVSGSRRFQFRAFLVLILLARRFSFRFAAILKEVSKGWRSTLVTSIYGKAGNSQRRITCAASVAPEDGGWASKSWLVYGGSLPLPRPVRFHYMDDFAVPGLLPTEVPPKGILNTSRRRARMSNPPHPEAPSMQAAPATPLVWTKPERKRARITDDVMVRSIEKKEASVAYKSLLWFSSQEREANRWHAMRGTLPDMPGEPALLVP